MPMWNLSPYMFRGHELCILNLPPGCDNMVNQLAKNQGVGISLFLTMIFFETSTRLNYLYTIIQGRVWLPAYARGQALRMQLRAFGCLVGG